MGSLDFEQEKLNFRNYFSDNYKLLETATESFRILISSLCTDHPGLDTPKVFSRLKDREESIRKFARKYQTKLEHTQTPYEIRDYITDLIGVRVICLYESDIELVRTLIEGNFEIVSVTDKMAKIESSEDTFGYKGLHLDLKLGEKRIRLSEYAKFRELQFELQIRTLVQDAWAVLDHKIKYKKSIPSPLKRRIIRLAALFELADQEFLNIRDETSERERNALAPGPESIRAGHAQDEEIDAFQFLRIVRPIFGDFPFIANKVDGFVQELRDLSPPVSGQLMADTLEKHWAPLQEYRDYQKRHHNNTLTPYTVIRHALFLENPDSYSSLLFAIVRHNFLEWLRQNHPNLIVQAADDLPTYQEIGVPCPNCGTRVLLKVASDDEDPKVRFCLSCNTRLTIDPAHQQVIECANIEPVAAMVVATFGGSYTVECPQCHRKSRAFYQDRTDCYAVCHICDGGTLLKAEVTG